MSYLGDFRLGDTFDCKFTTVNTSGVPTTLAGSPVISAYVGNNTTELTAGITLTVDFDARTGMHNVRVVATSGNGYATASNYQLVITTGTVGGSSVVGYVVGEFSIEARSGLMPTTAARTLGVSAGGVADANVVQIDALATSGNNATLNLKQLNIVNSAGAAIIASSTGSNGNGAQISGNGTGYGMVITSGLTASAIALGINGWTTGLKVTSNLGDAIVGVAAGNGNGISVSGLGSGSGILATAGATGHGMKLVGGATSGSGLSSTATTQGDGVTATGAGTGTGIAANIAGNIAGSLSGSVGSVTAGVTLAASAVQAIWDALTTALTTAGSIGKLLVDNINATIGSRSTVTTAQVNAEVVDALAVDTYAEPGQGTPAATNTIAVKIGYLFKAWRNRSTQTDTSYKLYNDDAVTVDQKATVSDDGTTYDKGEIATGP